jgi:17beta-estradiol 17-dehydrogenase / very-long-chain 3-oxoacyl-CoA reductase
LRCRIANELLARGCNVILHGRNVSKLESVQREFEACHPGRRTELFVYDASHLDTLPIGATDLYSALANVLKDRRLTILVNNVGHTSAYETVIEHSPKEMDIVMAVSMRFMTHVTRAALPHLLDQTPALIINVTGLTAHFPAPFLAIHSGAKAYIENFSRALSIELGLIEPKHDVECIAVDVHNVSSNSNSSDPSFFT